MNKILQNACLTFKYNQSLGRHGWLRLTPAYSVKIVELVLTRLNYRPQYILEPFSGTGTTELVCASKGIPSTAYDINPFLVWLAKVKTKIYHREIFTIFNNVVNDIMKNLPYVSPCQYPPIYNIDRWWNTKQLNYLARLKNAIWDKKESQVFDLLKIAFCRQIIELSNAAFNHISTSFKENNETSDGFTNDIGDLLFLKSCEMINNTLKEQPKADVFIKKQNSLNIPTDMINGYDTVITSPPYPNRISYIRELRPYMYWLDYLKTTTEASELDWTTVGGTWGAATSKLLGWESKTNLLPCFLLEIAEKINKVSNKSAQLMANYVLKYFDDMALHFQSIFQTIKSGGSIHYIVGNSSFYGYLIPSERIYQAILSQIGFQNITIVIVRKRNCNKNLYEYCISAIKP